MMLKSIYDKSVNISFGQEVNLFKCILCNFMGYFAKVVFENKKRYTKVSLFALNWL